MTKKEFVRHMIRGWKEKKKGFTVFSLYDSRKSLMEAREAGLPSRTKLPARSIKDHNYCAVGVVESEITGQDQPMWLSFSLNKAQDLIKIVYISNSCRTKTEAIRKIRAYLGV